MEYFVSGVLFTLVLGLIANKTGHLHVHMKATKPCCGDNSGRGKPDDDVPKEQY